MPEVNIGRKPALLIALAILAITVVVLAIVQPDLAAQLIDAISGAAGGIQTPVD